MITQEEAFLKWKHLRNKKKTDIYYNLDDTTLLNLGVWDITRQECLDNNVKTITQLFDFCIKHKRFATIIRVCKKLSVLKKDVEYEKEYQKLFKVLLNNGNVLDCHTLLVNHKNLATIDRLNCVFNNFIQSKNWAFISYMVDLLCEFKNYKQDVNGKIVMFVNQKTIQQAWDYFAVESDWCSGSNVFYSLNRLKQFKEFNFTTDKMQLIFDNFKKSMQCNHERQHASKTLLCENKSLINVYMFNTLFNDYIENLGLENAELFLQEFNNDFNIQDKMDIIAKKWAEEDKKIGGKCYKTYFNMKNIKKTLDN